MTLNELFEDKDFLRLLNTENSEKMVEYLETANVSSNSQKVLAKMFRDLKIFEDCAFVEADPQKKYKYILPFAFSTRIGGPIDLRGATVYGNGIINSAYSEIIIDETTTIKSFGIVIEPYFINSNFKLTFLGIPKIEFKGIGIYPTFLSQIEINVKTGLVDDVRQLFDDNYISTDKKTLKDRIKEI